MPANSPSVYVIPIYEEEQVGEEDEEIMDVYEVYFQPPYREPPMYCSRNVSPPPYRVGFDIGFFLLIIFKNVLKDFILSKESAIFM